MIVMVSMNTCRAREPDHSASTKPSETTSNRPPPSTSSKVGAITSSTVAGVMSCSARYNTRSLNRPICVAS